jgi:alkaline phosphatase
MKNTSFITRFFAFFLLFVFAVQTLAQPSEIRFPVKREETPETWRRDGLAAVERSKKLDFKRRRAKNVILFVGDGMGITTLTAARILEGQMRGESGEENLLSFERFPFAALSRTYSVNQQTSDSAPTMSAIITGQKTDDGIISVNQNVVFNDYRTVKGNEAISLLALAEQNGKSTGIVSTARLTHATPAACYAHSANRAWESDADILRTAKDAYEAGFPDIARQLIEFPHGDGLEVALGGGRSKFLPKETADPEYPEVSGSRLDKRDLTEEWKKKFAGGEYIWNREQFDAVDVKKSKHLLGLFEPSHMKYEHDRPTDKAGEPSLSEMTSKAIDILSKNKNGYFLMVEAGRIDHAHHDGNAYRALRDTVALSEAVRTAQSKVNLKDTLIIVTADHSHTLSFSGYPGRGNNILGLIRQNDSKGEFNENPVLDTEKKPYTTLNYANGRGYRKERPELTHQEVTAPDYLQEATIPKTGETHGGEDVGIFAIGANAFMIHGVMEQNWIFYVMQDALQLKTGKN